MAIRAESNSTSIRNEGAQSLLRVSRLSKSYPGPQGALPVLRGVDLALDAGTSLALMGESGSGKSTLLHLVAGLDSADDGSIHIDGRETTALDDEGRAALRRRTLGVVFQQFNLVPSLTVGDNLSLQARLVGRHDPAWSDRLAQRLGLEHLLDRYPEQLSGGQQQRVAVGRALAPRPRLLLADEPTGNLDEATGDAVLDLLLELSATAGAAVLMVTHSARLAGRLDRRARLVAGRLVAP
ncbi:ABC transporter ATP-binding protein [Methylosinus sp. Ce-a6]|uniref:ABC transporter ATP-binding protein n=1 Tax=Methylosinus sp. Ce-a6 TaxID=2172005 RepID=UPI00135A4EE8|nr:ABC transporter ATP-binding protein [Methylosinus sp. Ce-a6]